MLANSGSTYWYIHTQEKDDDDWLFHPSIHNPYIIIIYILHLNLMLFPNTQWKHCSIEWSPKLTNFISQLSASHFVLPDLPDVYSEKDRNEFRNTIPLEKRIQTLAVCRHTETTLKHMQLKEAGKLLIVGGNDKRKEKGVACSLSTTDAVKILRDITDEKELWGVVNPNDDQSLDSLLEKMDAGMTGFITQPLLCSHAFEILDSYPKGEVTYIAGVAMPKTVQNLYFWLKLLHERNKDRDLFLSDPLFDSHVKYFESPDCDSFGWIQKELEKLESDTSSIDGVHFMPMGNIEDLLALFHKKKTTTI